MADGEDGQEKHKELLEVSSVRLIKVICLIVGSFGTNTKESVSSWIVRRVFVIVIVVTTIGIVYGQSILATGLIIETAYVMHVTLVYCYKLFPVFFTCSCLANEEWTM